MYFKNHSRFLTFKNTKFFSLRLKSLKSFPQIAVSSSEINREILLIWPFLKYFRFVCIKTYLSQPIHCLSIFCLPHSISYNTIYILSASKKEPRWIISEYISLLLVHLLDNIAYTYYVYKYPKEQIKSIFKIIKIKMHL